jgi:hypothetical protein
MGNASPSAKTLNSLRANGGSKAARQPCNNKDAKLTAAGQSGLAGQPSNEKDAQQAVTLSSPLTTKDAKSDDVTSRSQNSAVPLSSPATTKDAKSADVTSRSQNSAAKATCALSAPSNTPQLTNADLSNRAVKAEVALAPAPTTLTPDAATNPMLDSWLEGVLPDALLPYEQAIDLIGRVSDVVDDAELQRARTRFSFASGSTVRLHPFFGDELGLTLGAHVVNAGGAIGSHGDAMDVHEDQLVSCFRSGSVDRTRHGHQRLSTTRPSAGVSCDHCARPESLHMRHPQEAFTSQRPLHHTLPGTNRT